MRVFFGLLLGATVLALAFWAYQENYRAREVLAETRAMQSEIGHLREQLGVLKAEWAYLNRPDRLRELADLNFARLGLLPMTPNQFGKVSEIAYPPPPVADVETVEIDAMPALPNATTEDGLPPPKPAAPTILAAPAGGLPEDPIATLPIEEGADNE